MSRRDPRQNRRLSRNVTVSAAPFDPSQISGIVSWYRADLGVTTATGVSQWNDQIVATGAHLVQATGTRQPTLNASGLNGKPTISFSSAATQFLSTPFIAAHQPTQMTVFMVWRWTIPNGSFVGMFSHVSSVSWIDGWGFLNGPAGSAGQTEFFTTTYNTHDVNATFNNTSWRCSVGTYDQVNVQMLTDNTSNGTVAFTSAPTYVNCATVLGAYSSGGAGVSDIEVAEAGIVSNAISGATATSLQSYFVGRYGAI